MEERSVLVVLKSFPQLLIPEHLACSYDVDEFEKVGISHGIFCQDYGTGETCELPFVGVGIGNVETGDGGGDDFVACLWDGPFYLCLVVRGERRGHPQCTEDVYKGRMEETRVSRLVKAKEDWVKEGCAQSTHEGTQRYDPANKPQSRLKSAEKVSSQEKGDRAMSRGYTPRGRGSFSAPNRGRGGIFFLMS